MRILVMLSSVLAAIVPAHAIVAWSGTACNGAQGANNPCDGTCFTFEGRHSFVADFAGGTGHCVRLYRGAGCTGQFFDFRSQSSQCSNTDGIGIPILSMRCFPTVICN